MMPIAGLSFVAVACGVTALRRRPADQWVAALAVAGAVVDAIVLLVAGGAIVVSWVTDPIANSD